MRALAATGTNIAILTGVALMPLVAAVGFWSEGLAARPALPVLADLRGSFDGTSSIPLPTRVPPQPR